MKSLGKYKVIIVRHGASEWTTQNRFSGWVNVDLSQKGILQAIRAANLIKATKYNIDIAFTSALKRAQQTLQIILEKIGQVNMPVCKTWHLNERHYGALTGMNRIVMVEKYGLEQIMAWRKSYDTAPPPIEKDHPYYIPIVKDKYFKDGPTKDEFPASESLKSLSERVIPYWNQHIVPKIKENKNILLVTHGSTSKVIVKHLENIPDADIKAVNILSAIPFEYDLDDDVKPIEKMKFLADEKIVSDAVTESKKFTS